jgi:hypothetical protein
MLQNKKYGKPGLKFQYSGLFYVILNLCSVFYKHVIIGLMNTVTNGTPPWKNLSFEQIKFKVIRAKEY